MFGDILVGLLLAGIGAVVCFAGLRAFFVILPVVGFVTGFYIGAAGTRSVLGEGFLSSVTGVIVALVVGTALAVLAYFLWYVGALISAGSTGALLGSGFMQAIGADSGWAIFLGAAIGGIAIFVLAFVLALPVYVVVINTAFVGAGGVVGGLLLLLNRINLDELGYGVTWAAINDSWFWLLVWAVMAIAGVIVQLQSIAKVTLPKDPWTQAQPA